MLPFGLGQALALAESLRRYASSTEGNPQMSTAETGSSRVKRGLAEMLKGGVIMDVVTAEQARIAEDAGAVAVMALERVPADIRAQGGVARMSDPDLIEAIIAAPSLMRRRASPRSRQPQTNGTVKAFLSMWCASSAGVSTSDSSM